jgi:dienelactone hydrolase
MTDEVPGFAKTTFAYAGKTRDVYRAGSGPAVLVIHEMPGLHPLVTEFGQRLVDEGYTVFVPSLFGRPGAPFAGGPMARALGEVCVSREFSLLSTRTPRVISWLRALAQQAHTECGGPGAGAIGMCFSGGFVLAMAVEPAVVAPVLSQPGLPAPVSARRRAAIQIDPADLARVKERTREDGLCVLGMRFTGDRGSPPERFAMLREELGGAFDGIEIDSSPGNAAGIKKSAHSVLTLELVDQPGHPTRDAYDRLLVFLADRLRVNS